MTCGAIKEEMSMATINNIRFPHRCTIYEISGVTPFSDGEKRVVWNGRCRKEIRSFGVREDVPRTGYRVQLGCLIGGDLSGDVDAAYVGNRGSEIGAKVPGIKPGMLIDVEDAQDTYTGYTIRDAICGRLGTSVYFEDSKT